MACPAPGCATPCAARLGAGPYRGAFALASLLGIAWLISAYRHAPGIPLWGLLLGLRPAAYLVNGDLASLILFGSLLILALGGTVSIDAKRRRTFGEQWAQFASVTSSIPFAAIIAGRNQLGPALVEIGVWRPLVATLVYAVAFYLHGRLGAPLT